MVLTKHRKHFIISQSEVRQQRTHNITTTLSGDDNNDDDDDAVITLHESGCLITRQCHISGKNL